MTAPSKTADWIECVNPEWRDPVHILSIRRDAVSFGLIQWELIVDTIFSVAELETNGWVKGSDDNWRRA